ncbi:MAG: hypothetical protein HYV07_08095 [Deltaproteobacteria bacterium]|nr:hypothetical protein [Deltaproteobacteria bacterium]
MSPNVKSLFDLPESIHRILFVEKLSEAVNNPGRTASTYVVTPPIAESFEKTLRIVGASLRDSRSRAAFLHGSFGSGKSHFMAMVSLLLDGNEEAWRVPELHALRAKHDFVGTKKLLQLHFHMIGQESIEEAIFLRYLAHVRAHHSKATVPGVFADEKLFNDARTLLDELGDQPFFAPMSHGAAGTDEWGDFSGGTTWDRARFEKHAASTDPKEREELFSALVKTRFKAYAEESRQFLDLDTGLGIIGRHAKSLGYDGIVLFLDELVLWLASRASDVSWFHNEVQKMVKLVEAQDARRELPFMSFIARQRDLAEMVGESYMGFEHKLVRDSLQWSEGRYETVTLEDRNLPAIVERRVLKPKNSEASKLLDEAFDKLKKSAADPAWKTMLGALDAKDFRRLYPFSPALVDALVALSNALQRERTAIKLLTELLVEHVEELKLGEVVGVGDLYDVLAGGEATADGVMRSRFESAKHVYTYRLLPMLLAQHNTNTAEKCQRLRQEHPARLGCSNCKMTACRTDNRLVKTLIIAALVPEVPSLKDMTASKLVQLNHGSLRVPIPGTEASMVTKKLKDWAAQIGQLHVGAQGDPTVRLQLEGVELGPIIEQGRQHDSAGARQRVLRDLLFEAMGVETIADWGKDHKHKDWRSTDRLGHIRFGNVRKMGPEALKCPDDHDWRFIIDYPFDEVGFGPHDDEQVLDEFKETHGGSWTLVWLPSFFSHAMNQMLGELVILEHILSQPVAYVSHLSVENQSRAKNDLLNLKTQKQSRVVQALEQAYGLAPLREGDIDTALSVERHLYVLKPGAQVQAVLAANLATALEGFIPALLEARYPRHPKLTSKLTSNRVEKLVEKFGELVDSEKKQLPADRALVEEMRGTLGELGLVRCTEAAVHLVEDRMLQDVEKRRSQKGSDSPEVGEIKRFIDESGKMGLQTEALDLVTRCYARWSSRTFVAGGVPYEAKAGKTIPDHVVLEKPDLPTHDVWNKALAMAGGTLGIALSGKALHADNLKKLEAEVTTRVKEKQATCTKLATALRQRLTELGLPAEADRLKTATSAETLLTALHGRKGKSLTEALAAFEPKTSMGAVGRSIGSADKVGPVLADNLVFGAFGQLRSREGTLIGAAELLEAVAKCLRQDELIEAAAERLRALAEEAQRLLIPSIPPPPLPGRVVVTATWNAQGKKAVLDELKSALAKAEQALAREDGEVTLSGSFTVTVKGK